MIKVDGKQLLASKQRVTLAELWTGTCSHMQRLQEFRALNMVLVSFIQQVPKDIEEAALIDGASTRQMLLYIMLPLIRPALTTIDYRRIITWGD